ncbi:MAG: hypothetical protein AAB408_05135 [Patescibacteria group bacterium]
MQAKTKKGEIARQILAGIGLVGLGVVMVGAPNALQVIPQIMKLKKWGQKISNKSAAKSLENLKRRGLITLVKSRSGYYLKLTPTGQIELLAYETKKKVLQTPKRWDKKWRLLIFDIEERHRLQRDQVRHTLIELGFYRLQDSVWVYPYDCEIVLELLRTKYHVRHEALFVRADYLSNDFWLRQHFSLS